MEPAEIRALLEKYWEAETTVWEEEQLAAYFRQPGIAPDLESVRELFAWRDEESQVRPGSGFDQRMLSRLSELVPGGMEPRRTASQGAAIPFRMAAAAAVILSLGIGLLIAVTAPRSATPERAITVTRVENVAPGIKDTYTDQRQALAAVRNALLVASVRINEGEHITQKNITRLHKSWQVATGD